MDITTLLQGPKNIDIRNVFTHLGNVSLKIVLEYVCPHTLTPFVSKG